MTIRLSYSDQCIPCQDGEHAGDLYNPGICDCCGSHLPEETTYYVVCDGVKHKAHNLEDAVRSWDGITCMRHELTPGGIAVECRKGSLATRDGWILHVHEDGVVYLNPSLTERPF